MTQVTEAQIEAGLFAALRQGAKSLDALDVRAIYLAMQAASLTRKDGSEGVDPRLKEAARLLSEWQALVRGECPSLIDDDSGGDGGLDLDTDRLLAALKEGDSRNA